MDGSVIKNNIGLQVLTDTGWSDFDGIVDKGTASVLKVQFTTSVVFTTPDHKFYTPELKTITAQQLKPGMQIAANGKHQRVVSVALAQQTNVYDLLNVRNHRRFYANDLLSSNCEFVIADETLINPNTLFELEPREPLRTQGQVRWYQEPRKDRIYVVTLDPSLGTGSDPAAIQVFEVNTTTQIAEWRHNRTVIPDQVRLLADICRSIEAATQQSQNIYYTLENNTIGEAALISLQDFGEENIPGTFISEPGTAAAGRRYRRGFNTTNSKKVTACAKLKQLLETRKMRIHSRALISELKTFVAHGTSYAAKIGETDDLVMATVLAVRAMAVIQTFDAELGQHWREHDEVIQPMPFIAIL